MKIALTIAASDSSCGAGAQADLRTFNENGVYGVCAITNITAQSSAGVHKICKAAPNIIGAQIDAACRDYEIAACKIGMLYHATIVAEVSQRIKRREIRNIVIDPVISAKNGETLLQPRAVKRLRRYLIPLAQIITPNADEAEALTKIKVDSLDSAKDAARALVDLGAKCALVKGGHIEGDAIDVFYDGERFEELKNERLDKRMHGTGCVLSAAIAARLALGESMFDAVVNAKKFVTSAIARSVRIGKENMDYFMGGGFDEE